MIPQSSKQFGVCSWSLCSKDAADMAAKAKAVGVKNVQLGLVAHREDAGLVHGVVEALGKENIKVVTGMFCTAGEDYSTLDAIRRTGGVVPDEFWDENWQRAQVAAGTAKELGLKLVTTHAGFLPHDKKDPTFNKLIDRVVKIAKVFADNGVTLAFETGQETAETLQMFLAELDKRGATNTGVNFDPANMILYNMDEPVGALRQVISRVKHIHIKDAIRTKVTGEWGQEVIVGTGQVDWKAFLKVLADGDYKGYLMIEREAGEDRVGDMRAGKTYLENLMKGAGK
ncbi:MAG: sugar phosphate isomerase/epimerase [Kiritimatiellae bacterium]|nr:sugar phosphate isomerase/epimerase [Kiritimatiellia bacterium]MDD5522102.1 sugar phosphate isomerase/epimerase [Kiritimatiellia bacterium]